MSHSAIFWNEYSEKQEKENKELNMSISSAQSEKIVYSFNPTPTLRHNVHSIDCPDDIYDSDHSMNQQQQSNHQFNQSMPINIGRERRKKQKKKKRTNGC